MPKSRETVAVEAGFADKESGLVLDDCLSGACAGRDLHGKLWRRERRERVSAGRAGGHQRAPELLSLRTARACGQGDDCVWRKP